MRTPRDVSSASWLRRVYWLSFAVMLALTAAWALATPIASGPDENAHIIKAAAVVRGQLHGTSAPGAPGAGAVELPTFFAELGGYPTCFAFQGSEAADCVPDLSVGDEGEAPALADTWMVRNNPLYYAVVGLPSLLPPGEWVIYAMRLVSAALTTAVLAWGVRSLAELTRRALPVVGLVTAITPMVIYLNSTVNNSALEISAALALWLSLLTLVRSPDPARLPVRAAGIAVVSVLLLNSRGLAPVYLVAIVGSVVVLVGPWRAFWDVVRDRRSWPWLGLTVLGAVPALAWTLQAGTLAGGGAAHEGLTFFATAHRTFLDTGDFLVAAIGRFGWFDTHLPMLLTLGYAALAGLPLLLAVALAPRRLQLAMLGVVAVAVLVPVVLHAWQARNVGYIWTARYSMPLFVGVGVTAGYLCREALATLPGWVSRRLLALTLVLAGIAQLWAFLITVRRYTVGDGGSWRRILAGDWQPGVPVALLLLLAVAALAAAGLGLWRLGAADAEVPLHAGDQLPAEGAAPSAPGTLGDSTTAPQPSAG